MPERFFMNVVLARVDIRACPRRGAAPRARPLRSNPVACLATPDWEWPGVFLELRSDLDTWLDRSPFEEGVERYVVAEQRVSGRVDYAVYHPACCRT